MRFVVEHIKDYMAAYPITEFVGKSMREGWVDHVHVSKPWYWCMVPNRLSELAQTIALIRSFPQVTDEELLQILQRIYEETAYQRAEIHEWVDSRHNAGSAMINAMAQSCAILDDFPSAHKWLAERAGMVKQYIDQAFYPDGMCVELTTAYSASVSVYMQQLAYALRDEEAMRASRERLKALVTSMVGLSDPIGWLPSYGDCYATTLPEYIHQPLAEWLDLPWVRTVLQHGNGPQPPFTTWPCPGQEQWSGYYAMRSGWDSQARFLAIDGWKRLPIWTPGCCRASRRPCGRSRTRAPRARHWRTTPTA